MNSIETVRNTSLIKVFLLTGLVAVDINLSVLFV